jgi:opacity protein-like surface antigen
MKTLSLLCGGMKTWKVAFGVLLIGSTWAQEGAFRIGAVLLPQNTWLLNQDDSDAGPELDYEVTWGFAGGISASYNFNDYLGVGLDVLYSNQGQKYKGRDSATTYTAKTTLNYLKVPLLFRFNSDPNSVVQFSAFLGPQFSFLLSYKDRFEAFEANVPSFRMEVSGKEWSITEDGTSDKVKLTAPIYKSFLPGAVLGFGIGIKPTDALLISLHIRADYAFGDAENKDAKVDHTHHGGGQEPYWSDKPKYGDDAPADYTRPATTALTGGLQLGVYYTIGGR